MSDEHWATASASQLASAIKNKTIGSVELLEIYLDRIDRLEGPSTQS